MTTTILRWCRMLALLGTLAWTGTVGAQASAPAVELVEQPATGAGPLLVLLTGASGAQSYREQALAFAREGWLVHVVDSNRLLEGRSDQGRDDRTAAGLRALLESSLAQPQVRAAKAALVGYSLGGWLVLAYGSRMPDLVDRAVAYFPSTSRAGEPIAFLTSPPLSVPTLMLAGVKDDYFGCCTIERARALATTAALPEVRASLRLVEYPEADHGFVVPAWSQAYRPADEADAFRRAVEHLRPGPTTR